MLTGSFDLSESILYEVQWFYPTAFAQHSLLHLQTLSDVRFGSTYFTVREKLLSFLLIQTLEGAGALKYDGRDYRLLPGDVFLIDCTRLHDYRTAQPDGFWRYRMAHFYGYQASDFFSPILANDCVVFHFDLTSEWSRQFEQLFVQNRVNSPENELLTNVLLTRMLAELLLKLPRFDPQQQPLLIREISEFLSKHACAALSIEEIAARFKVSKFHLCREFKRYTGSTIFDYIRAERMSIAKQYLRCSDLSIAEVAEAIGFYMLANFSCAFRNEERITPTEYRRRWKGI